MLVALKLQGFPQSKQSSQKRRLAEPHPTQTTYLFLEGLVLAAVCLGLLDPVLGTVSPGRLLESFFSKYFFAFLFSYTHLKYTGCCSKKTKGSLTPKEWQQQTYWGWNFNLASNAAARLHLMRCWLGIPKPVNIGSRTVEPIKSRVPHGCGSHGWLCFGPKPQHAEDPKSWKRTLSIPMTDLISLYRKLCIV